MRRLMAVACVFGCAGLAAAAPTASIDLSTHSSDETDPALLKATYNFEIDGSTLTLTIKNRTDENPAGDNFRLGHVYFNAPDGVELTGFATVDSNWKFSTSQKADGFGTFDFAVKADTPPANFLAPGASLTFSWTLGGTDDANDFISYRSTPPPGERLAIAAVKFQVGEGDDSGFGAAGVIPLPSIPALAAVGLIGVMPKRRRRI